MSSYAGCGPRASTDATDPQPLHAPWDEGGPPGPAGPPYRPSESRRDAPAHRRLRRSRRAMRSEDPRAGGRSFRRGDAECVCRAKTRARTEIAPSFIGSAHLKPNHLGRAGISRHAPRGAPARDPCPEIHLQTPTRKRMGSHRWCCSARHPQDPPASGWEASPRPRDLNWGPDPPCDEANAIRRGGPVTKHKARVDPRPDFTC